MQRTTFTSLPAELRLQIWEEALSFPTIWAAFPAPVFGAEAAAEAGNLPSFTMKIVGVTSASNVGNTCREARYVMERSHTYLKSHRTVSHNSKDISGCWLDLDNTIVFLDNPDAAGQIMQCLTTAELAQFKHVVLLWNRGHQIPIPCKRIGVSKALVHIEKVKDA